MKEILKEAQVYLENKLVERIPIDNPCQMYRGKANWFKKHGTSARIKIVRTDGTVFMDWTCVQRRDGTWHHSNSIQETRRKASPSFIAKMSHKHTSKVKKSAARFSRFPRIALTDEHKNELVEAAREAKRQLGLI